MQLSDFTNFEKLIAPTVIKVFYWIGIVGIVLFGLVSIGTAFTGVGRGLWQVLGSLLGMVVGLLGWRIMCELYIVAFGVFERLGQIRDALTRR